MSTDATAGDGSLIENIDLTFSSLVDLLVTCSAQEILSVIPRWTTKLAGVETAALATAVGADGDTGGARRMMDRDKTTSRRQKSKKAKRAKAAEKNPDLTKRMQDGELSPEQMDNISHAADQDPAAATDGELIDKVANTNPEQGRKIAQRWLDDRKSTDDVNAEHERQRSLRAIRKGFDPVKRLPTLTIEGDKPSIDQIWAAITSQADKLYQADGGRDLPTHKHPRSYVQRLFDATHQLIAGTQETPTVAGCTARPAAVIDIPLGRLTGQNPGQPVTVAGQGPIPDAVAVRLLENCDLYLQIRADTEIVGQPLWQGRLKRHATTNQYVALAIRDRGCVLCAAPPERCHVHHLMPWHAPERGETNLNQLALLCPSCHTALHEQNHTLYWDTPNGIWATRPATPNETPPVRPANTERRTSKGPRPQNPNAPPPHPSP